MENKAKVFSALVKFQGEAKNTATTAVNPFFKSKYAPLAEIINEVRPLLKKNGLAVSQSVTGDGEMIQVITYIIHESGEYLELGPTTLKAEKASPQGAGSAITYARRYALSAALGISSEDDDDAEGATERNGKVTQPKKKEAPAEVEPEAEPEITPEMVEETFGKSAPSQPDYTPSEKNAPSIANLRKILKKKTGSDDKYLEIVKAHGKNGDIEVMRELANAVNKGESNA